MSVARGASIGTSTHKHAASSPSHGHSTASGRSTADVGVQMVHSQVFALDAIIQCKIADDERAQNSTICSICGGTAEEALEGELTLALGLADQRIEQRMHASEAPDKAFGLSEGECETARMPLSEMRGELKQLHDSLRGNMHNMMASHGRHESEQSAAASVLVDTAEHVEQPGCGDFGVAVEAVEAPDDSGVCFLLRTCTEEPQVAPSCIQYLCKIQ